MYVWGYEIEISDSINSIKNKKYFLPSGFFPAVYIAK